MIFGGVNMNMNKVAKEITLKEGGKINLSIAQVKEVIKLYTEYLAKIYHSPGGEDKIAVLMDRYYKKA